MEFAEAREAFYQPRDDAAPSPDTTGEASPSRRLRHVLEPLAMVHIWSDPAHEALFGAGLHFLTGYVGGRACVLGDVEGTVAASAFGVFEPGLIADLWAGARAQCSVAQLRELRERSAVAALREALAGVETAEIDRVTDALRAGSDAADLVARPLFAGLRALPWPEDPHGRLWHVASLLREHRGDTHLAACAAVDVDGLEANILTELQAGYGLLEYTGTRAWSAEAMDAAVERLRTRGWLEGTGEDTALSAQGRAGREAIEQVTDRAQDRVLAAIGDLEGLNGSLTPWADAVVERGWFPPDPYKRAAG